MARNHGSARRGCSAGSASVCDERLRVRGVDGHEERGWPHVFGRSSFHASPLAHDIDGDGVDVKPGKMSGPHFFIKPGGSVAMSSTTALHAVNE